MERCDSVVYLRKDPSERVPKWVKNWPPTNLDLNIQYQFVPLMYTGGVPEAKRALVGTW